MGYSLIKYMGSKQSLLQNGLGEVIREVSEKGERFVDLFCGSAAVSWYVATELGKTVFACDLQEFAVVLARSVVARSGPLDPLELEACWLDNAEERRLEYAAWKCSKSLDSRIQNNVDWHSQAQQLCESNFGSDDLLLFNRYGGHYFSPSQALSLDAMLDTLPEDGEVRDICLAATIVAASKCAAAPGHTAQPFKSTTPAAKYLLEAWSKDAIHEATAALERIAHLHAERRGSAKVGEANAIAKSLNEHDVVFIDPPYSAVQYSRFYHVLETVARGNCGAVEGVGRYPSLDERPQSLYSSNSKSSDAMLELLKRLSDRGCTVVLTFPLGECSNGMSGRWIENRAKQFFKVTKKTVNSRFSTLGGNTRIRDAWLETKELILVLKRS